MNEGLTIAVVGATGAVGTQLLSILEQRRFPVKDLVLFASERSQGKSISWGGQTYLCRTLQKGCFKGIQMAFFDASDAISKEWVLHAAEAGAWVVDNSATFRLEKDILLMVPEVNGQQVASKFKSLAAQDVRPRDRIVSGPNCVAVPLSVALKPILDRWGMKRVVLSTYQSTSGAGAAAMEELSKQTHQFLHQQPLERKIFPKQIAFNCIPHVGSFKEDNYTSEEEKVVAETRKLLDLPGLRISATAVRVPTLSCHGMSVNVECERPFLIEEVYSAFRGQAGVILQDEPKQGLYPTGESATGQDAVYVGRIRKDPSLEYGLNLWVVSDNLRKGAALNAVQMGEVLLKLPRYN